MQSVQLPQRRKTDEDPVANGQIQAADLRSAVTNTSTAADKYWGKADNRKQITFHTACLVKYSGFVY